MDVHLHLDVWKSTTMDSGVQCVMIILVLQRLILLVVNWDLLHTVTMDQLIYSPGKLM